MIMPGHIKQQVAQEFFDKNVSFSWKMATTGFFCFVRVGEAANRSKICYRF